MHGNVSAKFGLGVIKNCVKKDHPGGLVSKERHNERATSRKSDKSKTVSKERQEYCQFELKMTKLTLILILKDPYDA